MSNDQPARKPGKAKPSKRLTVTFPEDLMATYANTALIANTKAEIVLDFAQLFPHARKGKVVSRVVLSPMHAKIFQQVLAKNLANYERQFGEIEVPKSKSIADQFFSPGVQPNRDDDGDGGSE